MGRVPHRRSCDRFRAPIGGCVSENGPPQSQLRDPRVIAPIFVEDEALAGRKFADCPLIREVIVHRTAGILPLPVCCPQPLFLPSTHRFPARGPGWRLWTASHSTWRQVRKLNYHNPGASPGASPALPETREVRTAREGHIRRQLGGIVPESESLPLHLHTLDSLLADLVSGRAVETASGGPFVLPDERTRSALEWYRKKGPASWSANVSEAAAKELVDAILGSPPDLSPQQVRLQDSESKRLKLKKVKAHRFAGLHRFGVLGEPPPDYVHEFTTPITLFEGRNGSGKTSLLNAIIWALTGEMLRPQREPEPPGDFDCWVAATDGRDNSTTHRLSPLTPMPNVEQYRPDQPWVPADTWVELTFVDEDDAEFPVIRRSQNRSARGKLKETPPDLDSLGIDPIAVRIGTIMPGLLPLIKVGSESELGRAVSQLTGLSALVDLADHARRAKARIVTGFVKSKEADRDRAGNDYDTARKDLEKILHKNTSLAPAQTIPQPSDDTGFEQVLDEIEKHFEGTKTRAFESAREILGERFDPTDPKLLSDLEENTSRALERVSQPQVLPAARRLAVLREITREQLKDAEARIREILAEAKVLDSLAQDPAEAGRIRLYARVASWIADHPDPQRKEDECVVCGGSLDRAIDPVTGRAVMEHLSEAATDAVLLSQTIELWAENAQGNLLSSLPVALQSETAAGLPDHPCDLIRKAIVDDLFAFDPFRGVLGALKAQTASTLDEVILDKAALAEPTEMALPTGCDELRETLVRLDRAVRFARWRQENNALACEINRRVLGCVPKEGEPSEKTTLTGQLLNLEATVKAAQPVSDAIAQVKRLKQHTGSRRAAQRRLSERSLRCTRARARARCRYRNVVTDWKSLSLRNIVGPLPRHTGPTRSTGVVGGGNPTRWRGVKRISGVTHRTEEKRPSRQRNDLSERSLRCGVLRAVRSVQRRSNDGVRYGLRACDGPGRVREGHPKEKVSQGAEVRTHLAQVLCVASVRSPVSGDA